MSQHDPLVSDPSRRRISPLIIALVGGIVVLIAVLWFLSGNRNPDQDKLDNPQIEQTREAEQSQRCSANATYDLVKKELFRRALEVRGNDEPDFGQVAAAAVIRVENPVLEGEDQASGALNCSGTFYLDLPPGVVASGNHNSLTGDLDYTISNDSIVLRNAEGMISSLAALTRVAVPPVEGIATNTIEPAQPDADSTTPPAAQLAPPSPATSRPSFDCARANSRGEEAVCNDSGLAALDVNMAAQYRRSLSAASPVQKELLQTTRDRFLAYRDRCPNRQCMADAYAGRMREIRDIMEGRLTPAR